MLLKKTLAAWDRFWFEELYSFRFFKIYRCILFLGMAFFSKYSEFSKTGCYHWSPVGLINLLNIPCSLDLYQLCRIVTPIACILAAVGVKYAWTSKIAFVSVLIQFGMMSSFGKVGHAYHLIVMTIGLLSFVKESSFRDSGFAKSWQLRLIKVYIVWVYFVNGLAKMADEGFAWGFSDNLYITLSLRPYLGYLGVYLLEKPYYYSALFGAIALVVTELAAPLALYRRAWGTIFFVIWFTFHIGVTLLLSGHIEFYTHIIAFTVFLPLEQIVSFFIRPIPIGSKA